MNLQPVKTAEGRRLRDPRTNAVMPNVADIDVDPVTVDLDDPHWFRAEQCGDIVVIVPAAAKAAPAAAPAPAPAASPAAADAVPSSTKTA